MLTLLNLDDFTKTLIPITTSRIFNSDNTFTSGGLYSEKIFGLLDSKERRKTYSYIPLFNKIIHPVAYDIIKRLDRRFVDFLSTKKLFKINESGDLIESPDGISGMSEFIKNFGKISFRTGTESRDKLSEVITKFYKQKILFIDKIPIIPPDYRPIYKDEESGEWVLDELNEIYTSIAKKAENLKNQTEGPLKELLLYEFQNYVLTYFEYIKKKVAKKSGLIREQLLGKRVDYSARSVVTPDPYLKPDELGVPFRNAISLFEPFIFHQLMYEKITDRETLRIEIHDLLGMELNVDSVKKAMNIIKTGGHVSEKLYNIFYEATERAMKNRCVLMKRDPAINTNSYGGFKAILHKGSTITVPPTMIGGFNMDFDGDQAAIFHSLTDESQKEIRDTMLKRNDPGKLNSVTFDLAKEMWVGLYVVTKDKNAKNSPISLSEEDIDKIKDPYVNVVFRGVKTTSGRAIISKCFPKEVPVIQEQVTKKLVGNYLLKVSKKYGIETAQQVAFNLQQAAFKWATIIGPSMSIESFVLPKNIVDVKKKLRETTDPAEFDKILNSTEKLVQDHLHGSGFGDLVESGSTKGWGQPMQMLVAKGVITDASGNLIKPISGSWGDGLSNTEYFNAASGARSGIINRVINTADTGYLSRKLAFLMSTVEVNLGMKDCQTKKTLSVKLTKTMIPRLHGRFHVKNGKVEEFIPEEFKEGQVVHLRSPVFCKTKKLCLHCYGKLAEYNHTPFVGILAAQQIGERATQLIMRAFHTGGAVKLHVKDILKDIVDNQYEDINPSEYFEQRDQGLYVKKQCKLHIDMSYYSDNSMINFTDDGLYLKSLIAKIETEDGKFFDFILDYEVNLFFDTDTVDKKSEVLTLNYIDGDLMLETTVTFDNIQNQVRYLERLIGGRELLKDPEHLFKKILNMYSPPNASFDTVHIEILCSQVFRNKDNIQILARLKEPYDPVMINMKKVVFSEGFLLGLSFENVNESLRSGLIYEQETGSKSFLEKVVTGELIEENKKR